METSRKRAFLAVALLLFLVPFLVGVGLVLPKLGLCISAASKLDSDCVCALGKSQQAKITDFKPSARLPCVKFPQAQLAGRNFSDSDLIGADLAGANLLDSHMAKVNLRGANLSRAELTGAILSEADLSLANLYGAVLNGAKFKEALLQGANMQLVDARQANFREAVMTDVVADNADFDESSFIRANLRGARLLDASLMGVNFYQANLAFADLSGALMDPIYANGTQISGAFFDSNTDIALDALRNAWAWEDQLPQGLDFAAPYFICDSTGREAYQEARRRGRPATLCYSSVRRSKKPSLLAATFQRLRNRLSMDRSHADRRALGHRWRRRVGPPGDLRSR